MAAIIGAAAASARGTVRCGSLISPPMKEAASGPVQANAIVDQKMRSGSRKLGTRLARLNGTADPNLNHVAAPRSARARPARQREIAPMLLSHLAIAIPRRFNRVARTSPPNAKVIK